MAIKPNTKKVIEFLQDNFGKDLTAADVAAALDLEKKSVDGIFTRAIQMKQLGYREPGEVTLADGNHKAVKYLRLTEAGVAFDTEAAAAAE